MLTCLGNVEETLVPVPGSHVGSFLSSQDAYDRCLSQGLRSNPRGMLKSGSVEGPSSLMAHQLSGDVGCITCSQEFPRRSQGPPCARPLRQHIGGLLLKSPGGLRSRPLCKLACQILLWSQGKLLSLRATYISGVHNVGADILSRQGLRPGEWRLHPEVVELIWKEFGQAQVDLFASQETSHCPLWFSLTHPAPLGLDAMVQMWPELSSVCFFPNRSAPGSTGESLPGPGSTTSHFPAVAGQRMVPRYNIPPWQASSGAPCQKEPYVPSRGIDISPSSRTVETVGLASEGAQLIDSGLSTKVFEPILHSRAPSTRKLYALKWRVFTSWCSDQQRDPVNCPVGTVLEFLQERSTAWLVPPTLKVCGGHKCLPHSFGWYVFGERPPGISFPPWYFEAEACSSHQGADMGSGHCPARPFPGSLRAFRGGSGQVFDLKRIVPACNFIT